MVNRAQITPGAAVARTGKEGGVLQTIPPTKDIQELTDQITPRGRAPIRTVAAPSQPTGPTVAEKNKISAEVAKKTKQKISSLKEEFRKNIRGVDRNQRLDLIKKLSEDTNRILDEGKIENIQRGALSTAVLSTGKRVETGKIQTQTKRPEVKAKPGKGRTPSGFITGNVVKFEDVKDPNTVRRLKNKFIKSFKRVGSLPTAVSSTAAQVFEEAERQVAEQGRQIPIGEVPVRKETLQFIPEFLTDKELEKLSFGGLDTLIKRQEKQLQVKAKNLINTEKKKLEPGFQKDIEEVVSRFDEGKLNKTQAEKELKKLETRFKNNLLSNVDPKIDVAQKEVEAYINSVAKKQRKVRAVTLAPLVFAEGYVFGAGLRGAGLAVKGAAPAIAKSETVRLAAGAGFLGAAALQTPEIIAQLETDPTAFLLENAPFLAGATVGADPKIVSRGKNLGKRFIDFEKRLIADKRAEAKGRKRKSTKTKEKQKQVRRVSRDNLKELLQNAGTKERKKILKDLVDRIDKEITDTAKKQELKQKLAATYYEVETGVPMFLESGEINFNQLKTALTKSNLKSKAKPKTITTEAIPPEAIRKTRAQLIQETAPSGRIPSLASEGKFGTLGVVEGRIKTITKQVGVQKDKVKNLQKNLQRLKQQESQAATPLIKQSIKNQQKSLERQISLSKQKVNQLEKQKSQQALRFRTLQKSGSALAKATVSFGVSKSRLGLRRPSKFKRVKKLKRIPKGSLILKSKRSKGVAVFGIQGYNSFAKQRGKSIKLNKVPLTKRQARNLSAFFVDRTLSATGSIRKSRKSPSKPVVKVPRNYYNKTKNKYRDFKISRGKKVPLKDAFIEKRKFRLDTKNERQTIQQLKRKLSKQINIKKSPFNPDGKFRRRL